MLIRRAASLFRAPEGSTSAEPRATPQAVPAAPTNPIETDWPIEVRALFTVLTRPADPGGRDRRQRPRVERRVRARLLTRGGCDAQEVYLRDYSGGVVSFVGQLCLKQGEPAELELLLSDGRPKRTRCRVMRCRQFHEGWFEGLLQAVA